MQHNGQAVRAGQADGEMKEREKGVDYTPRRQRQGGITVSNSGSITVTPTYGRKCVDEDNSQAEEWAAKQEETKSGLSPQPPPSAILKQIAPNLTFNGRRPGSEESKQMPRPSRGRGRGTAFGRSRPAANTVAPVAAVPPESGPKRYSIQRGQRTVPGQAVKDNTLMSIVKDNTLMSVVTDPQQQKDLLSLASGPGPGPGPGPRPAPSPSHQILSGAPGSSIPTAIIPPYALLEPLTPAEQLVIQEFRHQIHMQQEQRRSGHGANSDDDDTPGPSVYSVYSQSQQMTVLPSV